MKRFSVFTLSRVLTIFNFSIFKCLADPLNGPNRGRNFHGRSGTVADITNFKFHLVNTLGTLWNLRQKVTYTSFQVWLSVLGFSLSGYEKTTLNLKCHLRFLSNKIIPSYTTPTWTNQMVKCLSKTNYWVKPIIFYVGQAECCISACYYGWIKLVLCWSWS